MNLLVWSTMWHLERNAANSSVRLNGVINHMLIILVMCDLRLLTNILIEIYFLDNVISISIWLAMINIEFLKFINFSKYLYFLTGYHNVFHIFQFLGADDIS